MGTFRRYFVALLALGFAVTGLPASSGAQVSKVVQVGDVLPNGTTLDFISLDGGVAINARGQVAFHGFTGGLGAVFTQDGLVAKDGDVFPNGTTLDFISLDGGVAINARGQVAFHGFTGSTTAVLIGH